MPRKKPMSSGGLSKSSAFILGVQTKFYHWTSKVKLRHELDKNNFILLCKVIIFFAVHTNIPIPAKSTIKYLLEITSLYIICILAGWMKTK